MKRSVLIVTIWLLVFSVQGKQLTDMAGRTVKVPDHIKKILAYDSKTSIMMFRCAGSKLVAKGMLPGKKTYSLISSDYTKIPDVDVKNLEEILAIAPEIIIIGVYLPENLDDYTSLQSKLNIPVVLIDLSIEKLDKTYTFLGKLLENDAECKKYSNYLSTIYTDIQSLMKAKPLSGITAYYCLGLDGLMTDPSGSKHTEVFDFLKIKNAAKVEIPSGGHAKVNMEQILVWNPDYIFAAEFKGETNPYKTILTSPTWAGLKAVKNKHVYKIPSQPLTWFDHPPSINRIPSLIWLCEIFYKQSPETTKAKIIEFYKLFYGYTLTDEEYKQLRS